MAVVRLGPARVPSQETPNEAIELLVERGYSACEIDFERKFWMDKEFAARFGELAREHDIALSVHAPLAGFMGHAERGKKLNMAVGMLDHSAGIAKEAGAELVVFHPGFLLGRAREDAIASVVEQLGELRERLEGKDRAVPFGVEVMGRIRDLGSVDDVVEISSRTGWVRPVLDFAHMHATSDGALTDVEPFAEALEAVDAVQEPGTPFHIHFSDIAFANRNETKHLPYGEGTLRADPLREALDAVRAAGDGDQRVTGRGVDSGDLGRALRRQELGESLLVDGGLVRAPAVHEELGKAAERIRLERREVRSPA